MFRPYLQQSSSRNSHLMDKKSMVKEEIAEICRICETMENLVDISTEPYSHLNEKLHRLANFEGNCSYLLTFICKACSLQLETAYNFKNRCESTYKKLINRIIINTVDPLYSDDPLEDTQSKTPTLVDVKKEDNNLDDGSFPEENESEHNDGTEEIKVVQRERVKREKKRVDEKPAKRKRGGRPPKKNLPSENFEFVIDKNRRWVCAICGSAFQEKWILRNHIEGIHVHEKPFSCDMCELKFSLAAALKRHVRVHADSQIPCDICGKKFKNLIYMKKHKKQVHTKPPRPNAGTLVCQTCGHVAKNRNTLVAHLRIHTGTKPFRCKVCSKSFLRKQQLEVHSSMHTGERSFLCHLCSKSFRVRSHLNSHLVSHSGERKHKCNFCDKSYLQIYNLKLHLKNEHTGEPRYECPKCPEKFRDRKDRTCHAMSCLGQQTNDGTTVADTNAHTGCTTVIVNSSQMISLTQNHSQ